MEGALSDTPAGKNSHARATHKNKTSEMHDSECEHKGYRAEKRTRRKGGWNEREDETKDTEMSTCSKRLARRAWLLWRFLHDCCRKTPVSVTVIRKSPSLNAARGKTIVGFIWWFVMSLSFNFVHEQLSSISRGTALQEWSTFHFTSQHITARAAIWGDKHPSTVQRYIHPPVRTYFV